MDAHGSLVRAEGIRGGVGMLNEALEGLLRVLKLVFPFLPGPVESRQPFELGSFVGEDFFCEEGAGCNRN